MRKKFTWLLSLLGSVDFNQITFENDLITVSCMNLKWMNFNIFIAQNLIAVSQKDVMLVDIVQWKKIIVNSIRLQVDGH